MCECLSLLKDKRVCFSKVLFLGKQLLIFVTDKFVDWLLYCSLFFIVVYGMFGTCTQFVYVVMY
jgi:hypothetical protein